MFHESWVFEIADKSIIKVIVCPVDIKSATGDASQPSWVSIGPDSKTDNLMGSLTAYQFAIKYDYDGNQMEYKTNPIPMNSAAVGIATALPNRNPPNATARDKKKWFTYNQLKGKLFKKKRKQSKRKTKKRTTKAKSVTTIRRYKRAAGRIYPISRFRY